MSVCIKRYSVSYVGINLQKCSGYLSLARSHRLHTDIIVSLKDIFGYISSETGRIWTKIGRMDGNDEKVIP